MSQVEKFNDKLMGVSTRASGFAVISAETQDVYSFSASPRIDVPMDKIQEILRVKALVGAPIVTEPVVERRRTRPLQRISELPVTPTHHHYFDFVGKVLEVKWQSKCCDLLVTDYTINPDFECA